MLDGSRKSFNYYDHGFRLRCTLIRGSTFGRWTTYRQLSLNGAMRFVLSELLSNQTTRHRAQA